MFIDFPIEEEVFGGMGFMITSPQSINNALE